MRLPLPAASLGCVGALLLLVSGCVETPAESPCAEVSCGAGRCVLEKDEPVCLCDEGYRAEGLRCVEGPVQPNEDGDDHADTPAGATLLTPSATGSGQLERAGDKDVFAFHATAGHIYWFSCTPVQACGLALLAPTGEQVATGSAGYNSNIELQHEAGVTGTYFVVVTSAEGSPQSYHYGLEDFGPDDHGGTPDTATAITLGTPVAGNHGAPKDVDAFAWPGERQRIYRVTVDSLSELRVSVRDTTRSLSGSSFFSAPATGTLVAQVSALNSFLRGGAYTLRVDALGFDDHGSYMDLATELEVPTAPAEAALDHPGDVDFFRFSAEAGRTYRIRCALGTGGSCRIELRDGLLHYLSTASDELLYAVPEAGTYTFSLSREGSVAESAYTYALEAVSPE